MGALGAHGGLSDAQDGRGLDLKKYDYYSMNDEADNFRTCRFLLWRVKTIMFNVIRTSKLPPRENIMND